MVVNTYFSVESTDDITELTRRGDEHPELQDVAVPPSELQLRRPLAAALCPAAQHSGQSVILALLSSPGTPGLLPVYDQDDPQDLPSIDRSHTHRLLQRPGRLVHTEDEEAGGGG